MTGKIVIIGGGWSGIAAAVSARKGGADVVITEKTDLLLGLGNVGGIMRNNGRYTAAEENIALGAYELFDITDRLSRHKNISFPGHKHASLYDVIKVEPAVRRLLQEMDIEIRLMSRATDVNYENTPDGRHINSIITADGETCLSSVQGRQDNVSYYYKHTDIFFRSTIFYHNYTLKFCYYISSLYPVISDISL
jgi:NADPH-dependent 2,4-dienoyl-CoA reductase/sulfur reductase-like enzyme